MRVEVTRRVYVGNLSYRTSWQNLKDHFKKCGTVLFADIFADSRGSKGCGIVEFDSQEEAARAISELHNTMLDGRQIFVREDREDRERRGRDSERDRAYDRERERERESVRIRERERDLDSRPESYRDREPERDRENEREHEHDRDRDREPDRDHYRSGGGGDARQVFVGNLPYETSWQDLKDLFRQVGNVRRADVMRDHQGRSKGCGLVLFETESEARQAIKYFNDRDYHGRLLSVHEDRPH